MYVMLVGKVGIQRIYYVCYVGRKGWYSEDFLCMLCWSERLVFRGFIMYVMLVEKVGIQRIFYICYVGRKGWYSEEFEGSFVFLILLGFSINFSRSILKSNY